MIRYGDVEDSAGVRTEHVKEWRDAAKGVARSYQAWCAASRSDRSRLYGAFCEALRREERAARQVELDSRCTQIHPIRAMRTRATGVNLA